MKNLIIISLYCLMLATVASIDASCGPVVKPKVIYNIGHEFRLKGTNTRVAIWETVYENSKGVWILYTDGLGKIQYERVSVKLLEPILE